jgi:hypothetical protein
MEHAADPQGPFRTHISAALQVLEEHEDWAKRAEWEVVKTRDGWNVIAWRIEYPNNKGPSRYLPWGYSVIELDSRLAPLRYRRKG